MSKRLDTHPSVIAYMQDKTHPMAAAAPLKAADIRALCLAHGADDAGLTLTFQRRKARNLQAAIHLTITDYPGLDAAIHISNQQITVDLGAPKTSDAHLALDWPTLQKLFDSSQPVNTFIASGSVTLEGNATLVEQMRACFPVYKAERK